MPDAGAGRKRQIRVTPGPFSGLAAEARPMRQFACGEGLMRPIR